MSYVRRRQGKGFGNPITPRACTHKNLSRLWKEGGKGTHVCWSSIPWKAINLQAREVEVEGEEFCGDQKCCLCKKGVKDFFWQVLTHPAAAWNLANGGQNYLMLVQ